MLKSTNFKLQSNPPWYQLWEGFRCRKKEANLLKWIQWWFTGFCCLLAGSLYQSLDKTSRLKPNEVISGTFAFNAGHRVCCGKRSPSRRFERVPSYRTFGFLLNHFLTHICSSSSNCDLNVGYTYSVLHYESSLKNPASTSRHGSFCIRAGPNRSILYFICTRVAKTFYITKQARLMVHQALDISRFMVWA